MALDQALQVRRRAHFLVYSGYAYERQQRMTGRRPAIGAVLDETSVLIDGPYIEALVGGAGSWAGSRNKRIIDMVETWRSGLLTLLDDRLPGGYVRSVSSPASRV